MEKRTKIIISATAVIAVGLGVWYFLWSNKNKNTVTTVDVPKSYESNPLVVKIKSKTDYILGTLDTMSLKNGVIVNKKTGNPTSEGLLQAVWRMHNEEFAALNNQVRNSNESTDVKEFAYKLIKNASDNNVDMFDPKKYSYDSQWYKDYLASI